ncbi:hypothetical protein [Vibrio sp. B1Z05]|uniref:hypothetical protein n=1 Tax=Vibrio sp. B1Z05 TaxID=2654980 RepID=UPI00128D0AD8|nr:hypothetical protein [Vibrio sp. B1Z05]MPW35435.1 hypothetical protein [Vibrio sp. B1Z05]
MTHRGQVTALGAKRLLFWSPGSSLSPINNCTELAVGQIGNQLARLIAPGEITHNGPPNIDDVTLNALLKGSSIRVDNNKSIRLRFAEVDESGNTRPTQLVEMNHSPAEDMNWMNVTGWDETFSQPEIDNDEYQQPDLLFFPELESDWPLA